MGDNKSWDAFVSYTWGPKRSNQEKVIQICNDLSDKLKLTTWIDVVEMQSGELSRKVFEGIKGSKLFFCFITGDYSDSKLHE